MNSWFQIDPLWPGVVLTILIKSALILTLGNLLVTLFRRLPSKDKHRLLLWTMTLSIILPLLSTLLPGLELIPARLTGPISVGVSQLSFPTGQLVNQAAENQLLWPTVLIALWSARVIWNLLRLTVGSFMTRQIIQHATEFDSELAHEITESLKIKRTVRFKTSERTRVPFTTGLFSPVVVLPSVFTDWTATQQQMVLWHELAHVKRNDAATFFTIRVLTLPFWFNPLYWITLGKLRELAETACDEIVLERGIRPAEYAEHLLNILQSIKRGGIWTVSGATMTRRSFKHIGGRIMKILTTKQATLPARVFRFASIAVALFAMAFIVSSCQVGKSDSPMQAKVTEKLPAADEFVPLTTLPEMIEIVEPEYPKAALDNDVQAAVYVRALILSDGTVHEALVAKTSGYTLLDNAAVMAAYKNKFKPGMIDNEPVACWVTYIVQFKLQDQESPPKSE